MTANRSLDEFADAETGGPADGERGSATDPRTDEDGSSTSPANEDATSAADETAEATAELSADAGRVVTNEGDGTDRPTSTYVWSPDGGTCGACGETVEERWRDGDDLVCAGCKEW